MPPIAAIIEAIIGLASAAWAVSKAIAVISTVAALLYAIFFPGGDAKLAGLIGNFVKAVLQVATPLVNDVAGDLRPIEQAFLSAIEANGGGIIEDLTGPFALLAQTAFQAATKSLTSGGAVAPDQGPINAGKAFGDAVAFGLGSFSVTAAFESVFPEKLNTLNSIGPLLATLSGFEEVSRAAIGPTIYSAVAQPNRYHANATFRSLQPDIRTAEILYGRGFITLAQFQQLLSYAGLYPDYVTAYENAAYRPVQPRMLANSYIDAPLPTAQIQAMLRDNAYSPANTQVLIDAMVYNSTKNLAQEYVRKAMTAFSDGVMQQDELNQIMQTVGWSQTAQNYATQTALIDMRIKLAQETKQYILPEIAAGLMTQADGQAQLEAAGIDANQAALYAQFAETKASLHALKLEATAEARAAAAQTRASTRSAIAEFAAGTLDAAGLSAALLLAGLPPGIVAATVLAEQARQSGKTTVVYGQRLAPTAAKVLKDQVAAILQQVKSQVLTVDQARAQLTALHLDAAEQDAILAQAAANISKSPGPDVLLSPLTGYPETNTQAA